MDTPNLVLKFFEAVVSWPVAVFVLGLLFIRTFREPLADFFRRMVRAEASGFRVEAATPAEQRREAQQTKSFRSAEEAEKYVAQNPGEVIAEYARLLIFYWFERAFNLIYGTQMALLEYLEGKGAEGERTVNLVTFYNEFFSRSGLRTTLFTDYLAFLSEMKFVEYKGSGTDATMHITQSGIDFLSYVRQQYPTTYQYRPF